MLGLIPGVTGYVSDPVTYTVDYFDGSQTYSERFAVMKVSKGYVDQVAGPVATVVDAIATALMGVPSFGAALAAVFRWSVGFARDSLLDQDGGMTLQFAYHYAGTANGGIDLTATPLPGVDPAAWNGAVNSLMMAIRKMGGRLGPTAEAGTASLTAAGAKAPDGLAFTGLRRDAWFEPWVTLATPDAVNQHAEALDARATFDYPAALAFARGHWNRDCPCGESYSGLGGDCAHFVSHVLAAAGVRVKGGLNSSCPGGLETYAPNLAAKLRALAGLGQLRANVPFTRVAPGDFGFLVEDDQEWHAFMMNSAINQQRAARIFAHSTNRDGEAWVGAADGADFTRAVYFSFRT